MGTLCKIVPTSNLFYVSQTKTILLIMTEVNCLLFEQSNNIGLHKICKIVLFEASNSSKQKADSLYINLANKTCCH